MKKLFHIARRQPSLEHNAINRSGWPGSERFGGGKSLRRVSVSSLTSNSIQIVRGAYNIDLNKVDSSFNKLHRACLRNDECRVRRYAPKIDCNLLDNSNRAPIHLATVNGNIEIVRLLLKHGARVDARDGDGKTPLLKSIECGHDQLMRFLLDEAGADPNIADFKYGNTAAHWAILSESLTMLATLIQSNRCNFALVNNENETCLHMACRWPLITTHLFESLIRQGADTSIRNTAGHTALDIAHGLNNNIAVTVLNRYAIASEPEPYNGFEIDVDGQDSHINDNDNNNNNDDRVSRVEIDSVNLRPSESTPSGLTQQNVNVTKDLQESDTKNMEDIIMKYMDQAIASTDTDLANNQAYQETKKLCDEFRRKFEQKNRDNCELEKKIIHLESQSKHLKLDISAVEEHNRELKKQLHSVQQQQEMNQVELCRLKDEVNKLTAENTMLKHERQQLSSELTKLNLSNSNNKPSTMPTTDQADSVGLNLQDFQTAKERLQCEINRLRIELRAEP